MDSDPNQFATRYYDVGEVEQNMLQRFHTKQPNQKYFEVYDSAPYMEKQDKRNDESAKKEVKPIFVPCMHAERCSMETCTCMQSGNACTSQCIWGPLSPNFFPGCECESKCLTVNCPCYAGGRECDPSFCKKCQTCTFPAGIPAPTVRDKKFDRMCRNDHIRMRREIAGLYKAKSTIPDAGLGLFCNADIRQGAYIGEYVGELLSLDDVEMALEAGDSDAYFLELPNGLWIDALRKGNLTRYMNDTKGKFSPNVKAKSLIVDGDYRVAFLAKRRIPAHTEMFFGYGEHYWGNLKG